MLIEQNESKVGNDMLPVSEHFLYIDIDIIWNESSETSNMFLQTSDKFSLIIPQTEF